MLKFNTNLSNSSCSLFGWNHLKGGQIHGSNHSPTFANGAIPQVLVFGIPVWYEVKLPRVIIQVSSGADSEVLYGLFFRSLSVSELACIYMDFS